MSVQRLLAFLALQRGELKRVFVAGTLWIDFNQEAANANLRTTLWRLKQHSHPLVHTTATHLSLAGDVIVDVHEKAAIAQRVNSTDSPFTDRDADGIMLAGELLPDWYDDWVVIERERFRQARLHALEALCYALARKGRYDKAIQLGLTAVADEPLRESAHRAVIRAHLAEGNRNEALRQYELCRRLVRERLGFEPSPETQRLGQRCGDRDAAVTLAV